jgi:WD40 repeat protein
MSIRQKFITPYQQLLLDTLNMPADIILRIIYEYDKRYGEPKFYKFIRRHDYDEIPSDSTNCISLNKNELYFSDYSGVQKHDKNTHEFKGRIKTNVNDMLVCDNKIYVLKAGQGVEIFDSNTLKLIKRDDDAGLPLCIAIDENKIYIVSQENKIRIYDEKNFELLKTIEYTGFNGDTLSPYKISIDDNKIYMVDCFRHRIQIFDKNTMDLIEIFGEQGPGNGQFNYPCDIAISGDEIFIVDCSNQRIQIFDKNTLSFKSTFNSTGDNNLMKPRCVTIDDDKIYVSNYYDHKIEIWKRDLI